MGTLEAIKVKILVMGDEPVPVALRIELTRYVADSSLAFVSCEKTQRRISGCSSGVLGCVSVFTGSVMQRERLIFPLHTQSRRAWLSFDPGAAEADGRLPRVWPRNAAPSQKIVGPLAMTTNQRRARMDLAHSEYPNVLVRMLNNCIKEPHTCVAEHRHMLFGT